MPAEKWESFPRCLFPHFSGACLPAIPVPVRSCSLDKPACFAHLYQVLHGFHICSTAGLQEITAQKWKTGTKQYSSNLHCSAVQCLGQLIQEPI